MIESLGRTKPPFLARLLHDAAFMGPTIVFRGETTKILQKAGPFINLHFVPWSQKIYNQERSPLPFYKVRYAIYILNSSVAGNPRIALQSAPLELKLQLMDLYASHHEATAIEPMLQLCNTQDAGIRKAARGFMLRYFEGSAKKARVGTIKLPGGVEKTAVLYLGARQQAYHAVKRTLEEVTHGDYDRTTSAKKLALQLFKAWDRLRDTRWDILFTEAYGRYREGAVEEAVAMYRKVLANNPNARQKELMFPAFMTLAKRDLAAKKMLDAMRLIRILSQLATIPALEADLYYLLGLKEEAEGDRAQADHWYKAALRKNPDHPWALAAHRTLSPVPVKPVEEWQIGAAVAVSLLGLLLAGCYLGFRGYRP